MSSVTVSVFRAAIRSPLRSKRAITSPVRARSKASGLTRIRVRLTAGAPLVLFGGRRFGRSAAGAFAAARRFGFGAASGWTLSVGFAGRGGPLFFWRGAGRAARFAGPTFRLGRRFFIFGTAASRLARALGGQGGLAVRAEAPARVDRFTA